MTPLLYACSTGLADVVIHLAKRRADMTVVDDNGRGCIQLASKVQGTNQPLANWLREHTNAPATQGPGRAQQDKQSGWHSTACRQQSGPYSNKAAQSKKGGNHPPGGKGMKG